MIMNIDLLGTVLAATSKSVGKIERPSVVFNSWFWISLIELLIIVLLLIRKRSGMRISRQNIKKEALSHDIDFDNIINSSFHATTLYNKLKIRCHPDLFVDDADKNKIALDIFQELTKNKTNVKRLLELKSEAEIKLNIIIE